MSDVKLCSDRGVDYTTLQDLLVNRQWKAASRETTRVMLMAARHTSDSELSGSDIEKLPCSDLHTIDQLWVASSDGHFGFSPKYLYKFDFTIPGRLFFMQVERLAVLSDNYIFLLHDRTRNIAAVVDPAEATPVLKRLRELNAELVAIFNTHHHSDHVGGNRQLLEHFPQATVYGGAEDQGRIPGQQVFLCEGDQVKFSDRTGEVFFIPGHTRAHIAYYFPPQTPEETGELFCGDTLFAGGCGRLFEGTPQQMVNSLSKLRSLPDNTRVWCAHEYTLNNLKFALTVDQNNSDLKERFHQVTVARSRNEATIPSTIGMEKLTNPFMRWDDPDLQSRVKSQDPVQTFARLRGMKDQF